MAALDVVVKAVPVTAAPPGHRLPPEQISGVNSNPPGSTPLTSPGQTNDANANPVSPISQKMEEVMLKTQAQFASSSSCRRITWIIRLNSLQQLAEAESRLARVHSQASHEVRESQAKWIPCRVRCRLCSRACRPSVRRLLRWCRLCILLHEQRPFRYRSTQGKSMGTTKGPRNIA